MYIVQYRLYTSTHWKNHSEIFPEIPFKMKHVAAINHLEYNMKYLVRILVYSKYGYRNSTKEKETSTIKGKVITIMVCAPLYIFNVYF